MNDVGLPDLACFTWCLKKLTLGIEPINFFLYNNDHRINIIVIIIIMMMIIVIS